MTEFVYMLIEREFIKCKENIYKIGRTRDIKSRLMGYPKGSQLLISLNVADSKYVEKQMITIFKQKYKQRTDIGTEYFEGILVEMQQDFNNIVAAQLQPLTQVSFSEQECDQKNSLHQTYIRECGVSCKKKISLKRQLSQSAYRCLVADLVADQYGNYLCRTCNFTTLQKRIYRDHLLSISHVKQEIYTRYEISMP